YIFGRVIAVAVASGLFAFVLFRHLLCCFSFSRGQFHSCLWAQIRLLRMGTDRSGRTLKLLKSNSLVAFCAISDCSTNQADFAPEGSRKIFLSDPVPNVPKGLVKTP